MDDWKLSCTGRLERVEYRSLDKTGRGGKLKLSLHVRVEAATLEASDAELGETMVFGIMARDLARLTARAPRVGDRVAIEAIASGVRPPYAVLTALAYPEAACEPHTE